MATYASLQNDITAWMHRGDLAAVIPSFVALAEEEIFKTSPNPLRVREMETEDDLVVTSSTATLPADYLEARYIKKDDTDRTTIYYKAPELWNQYDSSAFTIVGTQIRLPSGIGSNLKIVYFAKPAALTGASDTNEVLNNYYQSYFYASMKQAYIYAKDINGASAMQGLLDGVLAAANAKNKSAVAGALFVRAA